MRSTGIVRIAPSSRYRHRGLPALEHKMDMSMRQQLSRPPQSAEVVRILVADDDNDTRETLRLILEETNCPLIEATNGADVLDALRTSPHRLIVLLDLLMPLVGGEAVLRAVLAEPHLIHQHAYIVLTAADDQLISTVEPFQSRMPLRIVQKPFDVDDVLAAVRQAAAYLGVSLPAKS
ncbi:MAG TPA: response regulator [Ktedonobacterales bacterium]